MREITPRSLTDAEGAVLEALLAKDFPGSAELVKQLPWTMVTGTCDCGCATVDLAVDRTGCLPAASPSPVPSEARVVDAAGEPIGGILVFLGEGYLVMLEVYSFYGPPIADFPPPAKLVLV